MPRLKIAPSERVDQVIEEAAKAACGVLDEEFPGRDNCGITSNFQGLLVEVLAQMLKGRSVMNRERGHYTVLPTLVLDESFFGSPRTSGNLFLVTKEGDERYDNRVSPPRWLGREVLALNPDGGGFCPLPMIGDAWTSFEAAASHGFRYLVEHVETIEEAVALGLAIKPVVPDPDHTSERGYILAEDEKKLPV
jgi:hypothetical protein